MRSLPHLLPYEMLLLSLSCLASLDKVYLISDIFPCLLDLPDHMEVEYNN